MALADRADVPVGPDAAEMRGQRVVRSPGARTSRPIVLTYWSETSQRPRGRRTLRRADLAGAPWLSPPRPPAAHDGGAA